MSRWSVALVFVPFVLASPALAQSLSAGDKHTMQNFDRSYSAAMGNLQAAAPRKLTEAREVEYYDRKQRELTDLFGRFEAKSHPQVVERKAMLDRYVTLLREKKAQASGDAALTDVLHRFDSVYTDAIRVLRGDSPAAVVGERSASYYKEKLEAMTAALEGAPEHAEVATRRQQLQEFTALLREKQQQAAQAGRADVLAKFDALQQRMMKELTDSQPSKVVESREATWYNGTLRELRAHLEGLGAPDDPEVVRRRELLAACEALYRQKRAAAWVENDRQQLGTVTTFLNRFRAFEGTELSLRAAVSYVEERAKAEHAFAVFERERPEVKRAQERLAWLDQELERVREVCRGEVSKLDPGAKVDELHRKYVEGQVAIPRWPDPETPDAVRAFGRTLRVIMDEAWATLEVLWTLQLGLPTWDGKTDADRELRQRVKTIVSRALALHEAGPKEGEGLFARGRRGFEVDPAAISLKVLRDIGCHARTSTNEFHELRQALPIAQLYVAFEEGYEGEVSQPSILAQVEEKIATVERRVSEQVASERLKPGIDEPGLLATAERVLRAKLGADLLTLVVKEPIKNEKGSKEVIVSRTSDKIYYRMQPYDWDSFGVTYAMRMKEWTDTPERCMLVYATIGKNNISGGEHPPGQWFVDSEVDVYAMLIANLPAQPATSAPTPTTPTTPSPTASEAPAPTPTETTPTPTASEASSEAPEVGPPTVGSGERTVIAVVLGLVCCFGALVIAGALGFVAYKRSGTGSAPPPAPPG